MRAILARVPPPLLFVIPLVLGIRIGSHALRPDSPIASVGRVVGWGLVAVGASIALCCVALFLRRRTTIVPHRRARTLVTGGPFRFSRNPMYVALAAGYVGACLIANAAWPLAFLALPLVILHAVTIPMEERSLRDVFGAQYQIYASQVRRWL